ncbi:upstream-binding factor 1-like protein 1 [Choloepus didactylus]|uniref:upstream-binding factor 1-like protein 1 n=1 Tax=Choloepus didactylus TaxID=27675 RepID=UPI0018A0FF8C|nr:upstream-binding factor 1-like protein 1 [Choloepus didactylus]
MALSKSQVHWSKEDILMLLECMENNLPSNDQHKFKTTQSHLDWEKVAFKDFSGEMCKLKWLELSHNLRKFRTLTELVLEARELAKNPRKSKKDKKHPDFPKKPLTAYFRFFKEKCSEYSQMHPELKKQELTKVLSKKYKELPEQIKLKYTEDFQREKQEFKEKLAQFREEHPDLIQNPKRPNIPNKHQAQSQETSPENVKEMKSLPETNDFSKKMKFNGEPIKPPMNGYHKFHEDLWSTMELQHMSVRERTVEIGRRWQRVPPNMKKQYEKWAEKLQQQYKVDMDLWLKSLSPKEYAAYRESTSVKRKNMDMMGGSSPKFRRTALQSPSMKSLPESHGEEQGMQTLGTHSSETVQVAYHPSQGSEETKKEDGEDDEDIKSPDSSSGGEDEDSESEDGDSSSSSSEDISDSHCN